MAVQISASKERQEKLAFQGPDAIKWTYTVMPFGPTNGPATFITMIHDLDSVWKQLAKESGIIIGIDADTVIIVDDILNWAKTFPQAMRKKGLPTLYLQSLLPNTQSQKEPFFP